MRLSIFLIVLILVCSAVAVRVWLGPMITPIDSKSSYRPSKNLNVNSPSIKEQAEDDYSNIEQEPLDVDPSENNTGYASANLDNSSSSQSGASTDHLQPEVAIVKKAPRAISYLGCFYSAAKETSPSKRIIVISNKSSKVEAYEVQGNDLGHIQFILKDNQFPVELRDHRGKLCARFEEAPAAETVKFNLAKCWAKQDFFSPKYSCISWWQEADKKQLQVEVYVSGTTVLPESSQITARLQADRYVISERSLEIKADCLATWRDSLSLTPYSGWYELQLSFRPWSNKSEIVEAVKEHFPDPDQLPGIYPENFFVPVYFGEDGEEAEQDRMIRSYYQGAIRELKDQIDLITVLGAAVRTGKVKMSKKRQVELMKHPALKESGKIFNGRKFQGGNWRRLIDEVLPERRKTYRENEKFALRKKYQDMRVKLKFLLYNLNKFTGLQSSLMYKKLGRDADPRDKHEKDFSVKTEVYLAEQAARRLHREMKQELKKIPR